jgi:hypothetical protein
MTDLGKLRGTHHPTSISEHMSRTRGENWRDTTAFLSVCCIQAFGWLVWAGEFVR